LLHIYLRLVDQQLVYISGLLLFRKFTSLVATESKRAWRWVGLYSHAESYCNYSRWASLTSISWKKGCENTSSQ